MASSLVVFEAAMGVDSMYTIKSLLETRKTGENIEMKEILCININLKDCLGIYNSLKQTDAGGSSDILYVTHIATLWARHIVIGVEEYVIRRIFNTNK